jgi:type I restriction enzyme R subunit
MNSDTTEKGLETLIMRHMTGTDGLASDSGELLGESPSSYTGSGWIAGSPATYDREYAVDTEQLFSFLIATQPEEWAKVGIANHKDKQGMARQKFLARLQREITRRGTIDVLRHGIKHGAVSFEPVQHHAATALQPGEPALAGFVCLHQRPAGDHL